MKVMFVLVLLLLFNTCYAATALPIHPKNDYDLVKDVDYLIDETNSLDFNGIEDNSNWKTVDRRNLNFGFLKTTLWLRFKVIAQVDSEWLLHISYPLLDHIENTSIINGNKINTIITGDQIDFSSRPVNNPGFSFPYILNKNDVLEVYIKVQTSGSTEIPLKLMSSASYVEEESIRNFILGWMNGILIIMFLYNLSIYFVVREKVYLYYALNVLSSLILLGIYNGTWFQYGWPNNPEVNNQAFSFFYGMLFFLTLLFITEFLQIFTRKSWYTHYFKYLLYILFILPVLGIFIPYKTIIRLEVMVALIMCISGLSIGVYLSFKGEILARLFTFSWSIYIFGLICVNLKSLGILPSNWFTAYAFQFGTFIELTVLSIALAYRIESVNKDKSKAQAESIQNLERYQNLYRDSLSGQFQMSIDGEFLNVNPAFYGMLGYSSENEFISLTKDVRNEILNIKKSDFELFLNNLKKNSKIVNFETKLTDNNNENKWYSISMVGVHDKEGTLKYYDGSMISINELKENEKMQINAVKEKMVAMENLVIGVCHEMNTPLGVATTGLSYLIKGNETLSSIFSSGKLTKTRFSEFLKEGSQATDLINDNLHRLNILIKRFKNISISHRNYESRSFNIATIINEQVSLEGGGLSDHVKVSCPSDLIIKGYPQAFSDMIKQFLTNSIYHGFLDEKEGQIEITVTLNDKNIVIIYKDNGVGMPLDKHKEIFNPFYTTKRGSRENVGLGMFQVYNIVNQLLKGEINITDVAKGFEVIVRFPVE
jgi:PAS domain S-box-containing protein